MALLDFGIARFVRVLFFFILGMGATSCEVSRSGAGTGNGDGYGGLDPIQDPEHNSDPLLAPSNLRVVLAQPKVAVLNWDASLSQTIDGYRVEIAPVVNDTIGSYSGIAEVDANTLSATVTDFADAGEYAFRVYAFRRLEESDRSNEVRCKVKSDTQSTSDGKSKGGPVYNLSPELCQMAGDFDDIEGYGETEL